MSFKASSSDTGSGVQQVSFSYGPEGSGPVVWTNGTADGDGNWTAGLDTNTLTDGSYDISARSTDFAGKTTVSPPVKVKIDNTVPSVTIVSPMNYCNKSAVLSITAHSDDGVAGVKNVSFGYKKVGGPNRVEWVPAVFNFDGLWETDLNTTGVGLTDGRYYLSVRSTDRAGNQNQTLGRSRDCGGQY